jgi:hypothetical protein
VKLSEEEKTAYPHGQASDRYCKHLTAQNLRKSSKTEEKNINRPYAWGLLD